MPLSGCGRQGICKLSEIQSAIKQLTEQDLAQLADWLNREIPILLNLPSRRLLSTQSQGLEIENYIAELVKGQLMPRGSSYDVLTPNGTRLEVKYSCMSLPKGASKSTRDWTWSSIKGKNRDKVFDRLILVGEPNPHCRDKYYEPNARYILFDLSFNDTEEVTNIGHNLIQLNTNPSSIWPSKHKQLRLYSEFQVSHRQLCERYIEINA